MIDFLDINSPELQRDRQQVEKSFFRDGRLKHSKRNIAYLIILQEFEFDRDYPEKEVNEIISNIYEDYCDVRRYFVEHGWMSRSNGIYRRCKPTDD